MMTCCPHRARVFFVYSVGGRLIATTDDEITAEAYQRQGYIVDAD